MHFWKYCGAGNDFVILENFDGSIAPERYAALAAALCREHFSVGADGLMVLEAPAQGGDCRMRFITATAPRPKCAATARAASAATATTAALHQGRCSASKRPPGLSQAGASQPTATASA